MSEIKPNNWRKILAFNIEMERRRLNLTGSDLSKALGLNSYATISVWEKGRGLPTMEVFEKLCQFFKRTPTEMMYEDLRGKPPDVKPLIRVESDVGEGVVPTESPPLTLSTKERKLALMERLINQLEEL